MYKGKELFIEVGKLLKNARLDKSLTVKDIENKLKIKSRYIETIESGEIEDLNPDNSQYIIINSYIRSYASLLEVDIESFKEELDNKKKECAKSIIQNLSHNYVEYQSIFPSKTTIFTTLLILMFFYIFQSNIAEFRFNRLKDNSEIVKNEVLKNSFFDLINDKKILLLANAKLNIKITNKLNNEVLEDRVLNKGDTIYLLDYRLYDYESDEMNLIDVVSNEYDKNYYGTLKEVIKNRLK